MKKEDMEKWIKYYLTEQFIGQAEDYPKDECGAEARKILKFQDENNVRIVKEIGLPELPKPLECENLSERDHHLKAMESMLKWHNESLERLI